MKQYTLEQFVIDWEKGPISAFLLADAANIMERDDISPEKRVYMMVALVSQQWLEHVESKPELSNPNNTHRDKRMKVTYYIIPVMIVAALAFFAYIDQSGNGWRWLLALFAGS